MPLHLKFDCSKGPRLWLNAFSGEVLSAKSSIVTHIEQAPSRLVPDGRGGYAREPGEISSTESVRGEIWLRANDGTERSFTPTNLDVPMLPGHRATVVWGSLERNKDGPYIGVRNHTSRSSVLLSGHKWLSGFPLPPSAWRTFFYILGISVALGIFAGIKGGNIKDDLSWILVTGAGAGAYAMAVVRNVHLIAVEKELTAASGNLLQLLDDPAAADKIAERMPELVNLEVS